MLNHSVFTPLNWYIDSQLLTVNVTFGFGNY